MTNIPVYIITLCCRGGCCTSGFSWGRATWGREPEGVPEPQENPWVQKPPHLKQLSFYGNVGTHKNRRISPWHNALGFFSWGRSLKVHREIKRQSFMYNLHLHHSGPYHWFQLDGRSQKENSTQVSKTNLQSRFSSLWPPQKMAQKIPKMANYRPSKSSCPSTSFDYQPIHHTSQILALEQKVDRLQGSVADSTQDFRSDGTIEFEYFKP